MVQACIACGEVVADGSRFCGACGTPVAAAVCASCGRELAPGTRFCTSCGEPVAAPGAHPVDGPGAHPLADSAAGPATRPQRDNPPGRGHERKLVTVVFADLIGSTSLGERMDAEQLQHVLDRFFSAMREEIEAEGGTVEKFIGDAIMAAFGVPTAHEDDPARALRAAVRMLRRLELVNNDVEPRYGVALSLRIGVNTGEVLAATEARPDLAMTTGDAVNVAARLEQMAQPGQVLVAERTARACPAMAFVDVPRLQLRGREAPVKALSLVVATVEGAREGASARGIAGLWAPMVGRDRELAVLMAVYGRAAEEGHPHLVTIYGDAGVGKSRLTAEFLAAVRDSPLSPTILRGRCLPYGDGVTYWPLAEILKGMAGVLDNDPPDEMRTKIAKLAGQRLTAELVTDPRRAAAALAFTLGVEDPAVSFSSLAPLQVQAEMHAAWRAFFSAVAADGPLVVVIEDIHWADSALLDLIEDVADRAQGPCLILCPSRPELSGTRPAWGGGRRSYTSVFLDPLSASDAAKLVGLLLAVDGLPPAVRERILERAEGNPFFLEEIVRHLIDEGGIVHEGTGWRATSGIGAVVIPDTVQGVLAARIDLLDPVDKEVLQRAAVIGRAFWPGPIQPMLAIEASRLGASLDRLEQRQLIVTRLGSSMAGQPEYLFKHILTRDVAYESLPRRERSRAHAQVAGWLDATTGARRDEFVELLAHHWSEAHRGAAQDPAALPADVEALRTKALASLLQAGRDADRKMAVAKSRRLAEAAIALAADDLERSMAHELEGQAAFDDGDGDVAWRAFRAAANLRARAAPDDDAGIVYLCARALDIPTRWPGIMSVRSEEAELEPLLELAFSHLERSGDSEGHARLLIVRSMWQHGFPSSARVSPDGKGEVALGEEGAAMAMRIGRPDLASAALDGVQSTQDHRGWLTQSAGTVRRRLTLAPTLDDPSEKADVYAMAAMHFVLAGRYREAIEAGLTGLKLVGETHRGGGSHCLSWAVVGMFQLGEWEEFLAQLDVLEDRFGERRDSPFPGASRPWALAGLLHAIRGDELRAAHYVAVCEDLIGEGRHLRADLARTYVRLGRLDDAVGLAQTARSQQADVDANALTAWCDILPIVARERPAEWRRAAGFVDETRAVLTDPGAAGYACHADRLEGRAALATGDPSRAVWLLRQAAAGFAAVEARWERACTELNLAHALLEVGDEDGARGELDRCRPVLDELRSVSELESAAALDGRLSGGSPDGAPQRGSSR